MKTRSAWFSTEVWVDLEEDGSTHLVVSAYPGTSTTWCGLKKVRAKYVYSVKKGEVPVNCRCDKCRKEGETKT